MRRSTARRGDRFIAGLLTGEGSAAVVDGFSASRSIRLMPNRFGLSERLVAPSVLADVDDMGDEHPCASVRVDGDRPA